MRLRREDPPRHSREMDHALSPVGGSSQTQLSRPVSPGHHISMEHRLRRKHLKLNSDTDASDEICLEDKEKKKKKRKEKKKKKENK